MSNDKEPHIKELYVQLMRTVDPNYIKVEEGDKDFELFSKVYLDAWDFCYGVK